MNRDFNDSIADMLGGTPTPRPTQERLPDTRSNAQKLADHFDAQGERQNVFNERCDKCGGSGHWKNPRFKCFKCKGKGTLSFKTSSATRAKGRERTAQKQIEREHYKDEWRKEHGAEISWLQGAAAKNERRGGTFTFPADLLDKLAEYGTLTDGQLAAVQRLMARDQERRR